ncbi:ATP-binding protein [Bacillus suaedaesalsae]|nr:ATP-binding protein [Bacillus suaedaesalsae]
MIPIETLTMLGKPFYTTKTGGTGLGIMVSKKIIQNHNGTLTINSEEQKGTSVMITLPTTNQNKQVIHKIAGNE